MFKPRGKKEEVSEPTGQPEEAEPFGAAKKKPAQKKKGGNFFGSFMGGAKKKKKNGFKPRAPKVGY